MSILSEEKINSVPKSTHILCDFKYSEYVDVEKCMDEAIEVIGELSVVDKFKHTFEPFGTSLVYILSESHISIHTWEEFNYISCDMYTCGDNSPINTLEFFLSNYELCDLKKQVITRGV